MIKVQIKYETDSGKDKIIKIISDSATIKKISKPVKSGKYYRVYIDVE